MSLETTGKMYPENQIKHLKLNATLNARYGSPITNLASADFIMEEGFLVKNDNDNAVELDVKYIGDPTGTWVTTKFQPGWNPDVLVAIKQTANGGTLLWGF